MKAIVRTASAIDIISWRSLGSGVASTRNSARLSPICVQFRLRGKGREARCEHRWARDGNALVLLLLLLTACAFCPS